MFFGLASVSTGTGRSEKNEKFQPSMQRSSTTWACMSTACHAGGLRATGCPQTGCDTWLAGRTVGFGTAFACRTAGAPRSIASSRRRQLPGAALTRRHAYPLAWACGPCAAITSALPCAACRRYNDMAGPGRQARWEGLFAGAGWLFFRCGGASSYKTDNRKRICGGLIK